MSAASNALWPSITNVPVVPVKATFESASKLTAVFQSNPADNPSTYDLLTASPESVGVAKLVILLLFASRFADSDLPEPKVLFVNVCDAEFLVTVESTSTDNVPAGSLYVTSIPSPPTIWPATIS